MKVEKKGRKVYKLVQVEMEALNKGDLFCLDDGKGGPECMKYIYRCSGEPVLCVEVEVANA